MIGAKRQSARARFGFHIRNVSDLPYRRFELGADEVLLINPNTGSLPMFRTRTDAEITLGIYERQPILIREGEPSGNPWQLLLCRQFHMSDDSHLFLAQDRFPEDQFNGWSFSADNVDYLPLYEAKMLSHFDHRFSTFRGATQAQLNAGSLPRLTDKDHDDALLESLPRYWVAEPEVKAKLAGKSDLNWLFGWRKIARNTDSRTFVPSVVPRSAIGESFSLAFPALAEHTPLLQAVWSSLIFDYISRQKLSGMNMTYTILNQIACPPPSAFDAATGWESGVALKDWLRPYVLELTFTSWRLKSYAEQLGDCSSPFHWDHDRRALLRADLDAAAFHVYGLDPVETEHVIDSCDVLRRQEERDFGEYRTKRLVLEGYQRMSTAIASSGMGWRPLADPPAGFGPRHSEN